MAKTGVGRSKRCFSCFRCSSCFTALILCFCGMCFLASCSGNGGTSDFGGETYAVSGSGDISSTNDNEQVAWDIMSQVNAGNSDKVIELLTIGQDNGSGRTTPMDISISDLGLPAGTTGTVTITMTVNGETQTLSADIAGGSLHFDIPVVPDGSAVSVEMTVYNKTGIPLYSGKTAKTVSGTNDMLRVTLEPQLSKTVTASGSSSSTVQISYPNTAQAGTTTGLLELNGIDCRIPSSSWVGDAIRIGNSKPGLTATVYVDLEGFNNAVGTTGGALHLSGNSGAAVNVVFCTSSAGGQLNLATTSSDNAKIAVTFVTASFSVMEGCTAYDMWIQGTGYSVSYSDFDAFIAAAQADNDPGHTATFKIRRDD